MNSRGRIMLRMAQKINEQQKADVELLRDGQNISVCQPDSSSSAGPSIHDCLLTVEVGLSEANTDKLSESRKQSISPSEDHDNLEPELRWPISEVGYADVPVPGNSRYVG